MNRHHFASSLDGHPVLVVVGRPTARELVMNIIHRGKEDDSEEPLYSSAADPGRNWADPSTVLAKLAEFEVPVPASLIPALAGNPSTSNQFVFHYFDRSPQVARV